MYASRVPPAAYQIGCGVDSCWEGAYHLIRPRQNQTALLCQRVVLAYGMLAPYSVHVGNFIDVNDPRARDHRSSKSTHDVYYRLFIGLRNTDVLTIRGLEVANGNTLRGYVRLYKVLDILRRDRRPSPLTLDACCLVNEVIFW